MGKKNLQAIICVSVFVAVFAALLTVASLYDLQISKALASGGLGKGMYFTDNGFALFFEATGFITFYLSGAAASLICVAAAINMRGGEKFFFVKELKGAAYIAVKAVIITAFSAFAVYEMYCVVHEPIKYIEKYLRQGMGGADAAFMFEKPYFLAVQVISAAVLCGLILPYLIKLKKENILKLLKVAVILFLTELLYLAVVDAVKTPIGRMRYRAMNALGDFSYYTPWYVINGARNVAADGSVVQGSLDSSKCVLGVSDTCKSFPSGHTYGAAMTFILVCLPDLFETFKNKCAKAVCWALPALYTVTVAISRIVAGAHFFSDVLVGGTLAFAIIIILREIIILKCSHFRWKAHQPTSCSE